MPAFKNRSQPRPQRDFLSMAGPSPRLSFVCITELVLSVQGILKAGVPLFILTGTQDGWASYMTAHGPGSCLWKHPFQKPFLVSSLCPLSAFPGPSEHTLPATLCSSPSLGVAPAHIQGHVCIGFASPTQHSAQQTVGHHLSAK